MSLRCLWALLLVALLPGGCGAESEKLDNSFTKIVRIAKLREWKYVVLHHTATETGSVESIDAAHKLRKDASGNSWRGIGYHFLIGNGHGMKDGEVAATFRWKDQTDGAHAGSAQYNTQGIGICLVGNFDDEPPTPAQMKALRDLMATLRTECRIETDGIVRHTDIKATACPGKKFPWDTLLSSLPKDEDAQLVRTGLSK
jgi:N-acetyl-anhydromuramyl-L-alanine amidase AmpD